MACNDCSTGCNSCKDICSTGSYCSNTCYAACKQLNRENTKMINNNMPVIHSVETNLSEDISKMFDIQIEMIIDKAESNDLTGITAEENDLFYEDKKKKIINKIKGQNLKENKKFKYAAANRFIDSQSQKRKNYRPQSR